MYKKISDYGIIGNLYTVALVGLDGSIDWLCLPHLDSPSAFGSLLDDRRGGRFKVCPALDEVGEQGGWDSVASYEQGTNILVTGFRTRTGEITLTDFMPLGAGCGVGPDAGDIESHEVYRLLEAIKGNVDVAVTFEPAFDYARAETTVEPVAGGITARGADKKIFLECTRKLSFDGNSTVATFTVTEGERVWLRLTYGDKPSCSINVETAEVALSDTRDFWRSWLLRSETGRTLDFGDYASMIERSALTLKLLVFNPTGAIAAAATTSLPEEVGGGRNWDYRYTWVRDASFTLQALFTLGHMTETEGFLRWMERLLFEHGAPGMKIMYGLRGEEDLAERELSHLDGYKGSRPVRVGNAASEQRQMDIYGELLDAALRLSNYVGKIDSSLWPFLRGICDYVAAHWQEADSGIWEVRGGPYHFVHSRVMCWTALDRGILIAQRYGFPAELDNWRTAKEDIKTEVLLKGFNSGKGAFAQHYETDEVDAANLLIPLVRFLPFDDPRVLSNLEVTQRELSDGDFLRRYLVDDGLSGKEGSFLLCTFWLIDNLIGLGRLDEAEDMLRRVERASNHLGLFSEQYDPGWREQLGNFPQAFTHIGYINSVARLVRARKGTRETGARTKEEEMFLSGRVVLNDGYSRLELSPDLMAGRLKDAMNVLRGAFFDTIRGRVAYEEMRGAGAYADYLKLSYALRNMDLSTLQGGKEMLAFWINLYNVLVIHGVIALGVRDSVKEARGFFRRIQYRIGGMDFSPDDIEHGILRGNRRPPGAILKSFGNKDERLSLSARSLDPRIHFALVCASSSCPPIGVYTTGGIDKELDIAAETFLNSGGLLLNREKGRISLSMIFSWYAGDFGGSQTERLNYLARFIHDDTDREYIVEHASTLRVEYQRYDWRLNRSPNIS